MIHFKEPDVVKFRCMKCLTDLDCKIYHAEIGPMWYYRIIPNHKNGKAVCDTSGRDMDDLLIYSKVKLL